MDPFLDHVRGKRVSNIPSVERLRQRRGNQLHDIEFVLDGLRLGRLSDSFIHQRPRARSQPDARILERIETVFVGFWGGGGSYGGRGGNGYGFTVSGDLYGDEKIDTLLGGSGGQLGYLSPFEAHIFDRPRGRGGSGGGALEIVAINDIVLGENANIQFDGEAGFSSMMNAGGGGSGGSVLLSAGGIIRHDGRLSVRGGMGAEAELPNSRSDIINGHGGGGGGGRVAMFSQSITFGSGSEVNVGGGGSATGCSDEVAKRDCNGGDGSFYTEEELGHDVYLDHTKGAMGTKSSIFLKHAEVTKTASGNDKRTPFTQNGPEFVFDSSTNGQPGRATFFVQLGDESQTGGEVKKDGWGTIFELREDSWQSYNESHKVNNATAVVGIFVGKTMKHGSGYFGIPGDGFGVSEEEGGPLATFHDYTVQGKWYKIDIRIDWLKKIYSVYLDDVLSVDFAPLVGTEVSRLGLSTFHAASAWYDEVYVGVDATMNFKCPKIVPEGVEMTRPVQSGWKASDIGGWSYNHKMQRHESHMSNKAKYKRTDAGGLVPFDGEGHQAYNSDIKYRFADGDHKESAGKLNAGTLLQVEEEQVSDSIYKRGVSR